MRRELNIWVIGGDQRQARLAELLDSDGHTVHTYALDRAPELYLPKEKSLREIEFAHCVVLPLPVVGDGSMLNAPLASAPHTLGSILDVLRPGQIVCAGRITPEISAMAEERGLSLHDYLNREELAVANAIPAVLAVSSRWDPDTLFPTRFHLQNVDSQRSKRGTAKPMLAVPLFDWRFSRQIDHLIYPVNRFFTIQHTILMRRNFQCQKITYPLE